jgi:hypothetical protein
MCQKKRKKENLGVTGEISIRSIDKLAVFYQYNFLVLIIVQHFYKMLVFEEAG